jgi:ADP-sugar diphosphatase
MTLQPRIPGGSLSFAEIPAGMLDDSGTFAGAAAKEIQEKTALIIPESELTDMTRLAIRGLDNSQDCEKLQEAIYPLPGGSDEFIPVFVCEKELPRKKIENMQGRLTGLRKDGEKITLKLVPLKDLWKEGARDGKTLAAWALYEGLKKEGKI